MALARAEELVVARSGGELVGGCTLAPEADAEWIGHDQPSLYLHRLVVARSHAGQGVARRIVDWCVQHAHRCGAQRLRLDCWDGNVTLRGFYRACGFRELHAVASAGHDVRLFELDVSRPFRA
jgi:GNAT superfamily N-acetyltransferase